MEPFVGLGRVDIGTLSCRCARTCRVFETVGLAVSDLFNQRQRIAEVFLGLAREADDEITRKQQVRTRFADTFDQADIALSRVLAVHEFQDFVRARLHR